MPVARVQLREARLRRLIRLHFHSIGLKRDALGALEPRAVEKEDFRRLHASQRVARIEKESSFIQEKGAALIEHFASGSEIDLGRIAIRLELINSNTWQSDLFRFACLLWSIPVSQGFGRRMRFLVWDDWTGCLVGIFALGDPVFNLRARDAYIGWSGADRTERLVNLLDGYVVGAVPPYNKLLGGKLVACLMRSKEIVESFAERYVASEGLISRQGKRARLVAVTTTSALGRSSIYNRLKLDGVPYLQSIGFTDGFGHFHFPDSIVEEMRGYLHSRDDSYASNYEFGQGPNWRLRLIRKTLNLLDMGGNLVRHGLRREVFVSLLADNAIAVLRGDRKRPIYGSLRSADEVAQMALARWVLPRASRDQSFRLDSRETLWSQIVSRDSIRMGAASVREKRS